MTRGAITRARRTLATTALAGALLLWALAGTSDAAVSVSIGAPAGAPVPSGFLGVSFETSALLPDAGDTPAAIDPVLVQLLRTIAPSGAVLRIGGDSTDRTWWPVPGIRRPGWAHTVLDANWAAVARALATAIHGKLILGINLEAANARIADTEAGQLVRRIGTGRVDALELGNEPELYPAFPWYRTSPTNIVFGRTMSWDPAVYTAQYAQIAKGFPRVPLAGPAVGSTLWSQSLAPFLAANPRVRIATLHRYPTKRCTKTTRVTAAQLLSPVSTVGLAESVAPYVQVARRAGVRLRIDELNAVSCGGEAGLSNTFASSLWSLDALFALARTGVTGVNVHTTPGSLNALFDLADTNGTWSARVHPLYDGLLTFAEAAPAGSRLLPVTGARPTPLRVWATRTPDGIIHVVVIDTDPKLPATVAVHLPSTAASGTVSVLRAAGLSAQTGVTLGGLGFGSSTTTGIPAGTPQTTTVRGSGGASRRSFTLHVHAASATLLTLGCAGVAGCGVPYMLGS